VETMSLEREILALLASQRLAVLATQQGGQPYTSLMAFAHTDGLRTLLVATATPTRKFANILEDPRVALLIDSRGDGKGGFEGASALTALGTAVALAKNDPARHRQTFLARHPALTEFLNAGDTVLVMIRVVSYQLVTSFQQVRELHLAYPSSRSAGRAVVPQGDSL
jgi:heme iron utilization protein